MRHALLPAGEPLTALLDGEASKDEVRGWPTSIDVEPSELHLAGEPASFPPRAAGLMPARQSNWARQVPRPPVKFGFT